MLRDNLLYALYEEIVIQFRTKEQAVNYVNNLSYLTKDENYCLLEMLENWYN